VELPPGVRLTVAGIVVREDEVRFSAVRASGPGGQNVNKVSSKVELRFPFSANATIPEAAKERLRTLAKNKLDGDGALLISSQKTRDQSQNLDDAWEKIRELLVAAMVVPKRRRATKPTYGSVQRRIGEKKATGAKKKSRGGKSFKNDD
jgi:ribosome-associated protein